MGKKSVTYISPWVTNPNAYTIITKRTVCTTKPRKVGVYVHLLRQHDTIKVMISGLDDIMKLGLAKILKSATLTSDGYGEVLNLHMDVDGVIVSCPVPQWREFYTVEAVNIGLMCKDKYYPEIKRFVSDLGMLKGDTR